MKIAVLMGGSSAERDASLENGKRIIAALEEAEHTPVTVDVSEDLVATLRAERPDACIVAVAGKMGEDGTLQGLLDFLGIPYAGSCSEVCRSVADKSLLSAHMQAACDFSGEQTVASWPQGFCFSKVVFDELGAFGAVDLFEDRIPGGYPLAVKPACEGLAYGVHKANNKEELRDALRDAFTFDDKVIVQQWIEGVELSVCILAGTRMLCRLLKSSRARDCISPMLVWVAMQSIFMRLFVWNRFPMTNRLPRLSVRKSSVRRLRFTARLAWRAMDASTLSGTAPKRRFLRLT